MYTDRYRKFSDLPDRLPVFPLRGVILLPRAVLPLNIFEPRYLAMIDDILGGERLVGIVQPQARPPGQPAIAAGEAEDETESPRDRTWPLRETGCLGRVTAFSEQDDGRMLITLTGVARFRILAESETTKPYRICRISTQEFADDLSSERGENEVDREKLLELLRAYLDARDLSADWRGIQQSSTEFLVNTLSIHSPFGPEEKQALLESADLKARSEILMALAEMDLATHGDGNSNGPMQ